MQTALLATAWTARALTRVWPELGRRSAVVVVVGILSVDLCAAAVGADD